MRAEEGESGEVGVGEAVGFEEMDGGEDVIDGVGRLEVGSGMDEAEGFEVAEVLEVGEGRRRSGSCGSFAEGEAGRDGGEWRRDRCSSHRHGWVSLKIR